jgi:two-component system, NarL family, response regulator LiaR
MTNMQLQHNDSMIRVRELSDREREVLRLLIEGQSNTEIAIALHLSPSTIKTHIKNIMDKFGVDHRVQVAVFALRNGLAY